ncbi:MAG: hypothetical protein WDZ27_06735 [Waddliaceae bacterium]
MMQYFLPILYSVSSGERYLNAFSDAWNWVHTAFPDLLNHLIAKTPSIRKQTFGTQSPLGRPD